MPWHLASLLLFVFISFANSKYQGLPDQIKLVRLQSSFKNELLIDWTSFESDITSFKYQVENLHNSTVSKWHETPQPYYQYNMEPNGIYKVNVIPINKQGEGPPSPDVFFYNGPEQKEHYVESKGVKQLQPSKCEDLVCVMSVVDRAMETTQFLFDPKAPDMFRVISNSEDRANITWRHKRMLSASNTERSPIEYTFRYADTEDLSVWNTIKTNNKWIILENLKNGTVYNAFVTARENGRISPYSDVIPFMAYEDMTGLPEPVITIKPTFKNGVFSPGDRITVKCSLPPNTKMNDLSLQLTVGSRRIRPKNKNSTSVHVKTTANKLVNKAKCRVIYSIGNDTSDPIQSTRTSTQTWTVLPSLESEFNEPRQEEMEEEQVDFRKI